MSFKHVVSFKTPTINSKKLNGKTYVLLCHLVELWFPSISFHNHFEQDGSNVLSN